VVKIQKMSILINNLIPSFVNKLLLSQTPSNKVATALVIAICTVTSTNINAEERQGLLINTQIQAQHDNNVLRKIEATSDTSLQVSPELQYLTNNGKHVFSIEYKGEYTAYKENSELNYDNHNIILFARLDHTLKINTDFKFSYKNEVEEPGTNNSSSVLIEEFNQTNKKQAAAKFYYGTKQSIGQLVLALDHKEYRYTNNFQDYRDVDINTLTGIFYYRIAPKTRLLFQASIGDYNYIINNQFPDQSSKANFYLAGIEWDISAKTSGTFKLGYQGKNFEQDVYNDITGLSYMLDMTWKPNTYSTIKLGASRTTQESSQLQTSAFITNSYSVDVKHDITARTTLKATYTFDADDIVTSSNRTDKHHKLVLGIDYSLLTWLNIKLDYKFIERSSDIDIYNFKANIIALSLTTNFE
jgi:hypothetical protein